MSSDFNELLRRMNTLSKDTVVRRKCFVSYFGEDTEEVDAFVSKFKDVFIPKVIGITDGDDFIKSENSDYVMTKIREKYLDDSTVTIVMIGNCTHSRRYIDWEIKASLRQGNYTPNGLLGILLPSMGGVGILPNRFIENWEKTEMASYAIFRSYPSSPEELHNFIENANARRNSHANYIKNSQSMMKYNGKCTLHGTTH